MSETKVVWHKYPNEKPEKYREYIITVNIRQHLYTTTADWMPDLNKFFSYRNEVIVAWAELPKPYKEENNE